MPWRDFFKWAIRLADAIGVAHRHGIIHRDLKPANIMIGAGGQVQVLDFGVGKLKHDAAGPSATRLQTTAQVTAPHQVIGTAAYMSPEQAEGREIDARSDVFSLGVVLFEMAQACGRSPVRPRWPSCPRS